MQPYIPPEKRIPEFTVKAILLGSALGLLLTAANTYLGLYAGMTVSASIPAAVISMAILRGLFKTGTILENNIVQTIGSAGESLAAGIIFTIPALVITGVWRDFKYWPVTLIAILGGMLGVIFMIPLRRALIVEEKELAYPEGLACAEVLKAGDRRGAEAKFIFWGVFVGLVFKFFASGVKVIKGTVEGAVRAGKSIFYFGSDMSPALLAVGYIVGFNIATLVFFGGLIGWLLGIPIYSALYGAEGADVLDTAWTLWSTKIRFMGVGAMVIGGLWSIISVRKGIAKGIKGAAGGWKLAEGEGPKRTELDMPAKIIVLLLFGTIIPIFILYYALIQIASASLVSGVAMVIAAFFFVAVSSYIVGLVGSSNNPVSGMTICTILFTSALLLALGLKGDHGIMAALGVAGVVCCAAATAGDISQDLKTGYLVGATPYKQQWAQLIGVLVPAFIIAPVLMVLHRSYGIGVPVREGVQHLTAPQATLFASITKALFTGKGLPWGMVIAGILIGAGIIVFDEILRRSGAKFRAYVMPVAVGIYLPLSLSVPILIGGIVNAIVKRTVARRAGEGAAEGSVHRGVLLSSGLIAGEALMGIFVAVLIFVGMKLPVDVLDSNLLSLAAILAVILGLWSISKKVREES